MCGCYFKGVCCCHRCWFFFFFPPFILFEFVYLYSNCCVFGLFFNFILEFSFWKVRLIAKPFCGRIFVMFDDWCVMWFLPFFIPPCNLTSLSLAVDAFLHYLLRIYLYRTIYAHKVQLFFSSFLAAIEMQKKTGFLLCDFIAGWIKLNWKSLCRSQRIWDTCKTVAIQEMSTSTPK